MEEIAEKVQQAIRGLFGVETDVVVTEVPEGQNGDFATNVAMRLKGMLKDFDGAPREIANQIKESLERGEKFGFDCEVAGPGFLNFISRDGYWKRELGEISGDFERFSRKNISQNEYYGKKVICEFSDPNPFKVLHVGHLYTSIVGDSISRLVEYAGGEVVRANFGGDVGLHVAKTLYAVMRDAADTSDIETIAEKYVEGTRAYEDDEKAKAEIVKLNKSIYEIAEAGLEKSWNGEMAKIAELYWRGRETSYRYFEDFYQKVGVKFDKYYPESTVALRGLKEVTERVGQVYEKSNGAVIFAGEKYGLHTRVFVNAEGLPTYEAKDVGLIFTKWDDYKFDKSIVITGNDVIDYMKVVLKSVSLYAPELVERTLHMTHGNVRLPGNEKMSSRKGNFIRAVDVLDEVEKLVNKAAETNEASGENGGAKGDVTKGDKENVNRKVSLGAIKYAFLKYKIGGNIEFDAKESVSTTGNSGVYLLYSAVRAKKILKGIEKTEGEKAGGENGGGMASGEESGTVSGENGGAQKWTLNEYEKKLVRKLTMYSQVLSEAVQTLAPHKVANYLYETAQEFSRFYEKVKVAGSEFETERAEIVRAYLNVMTSGLGLLGMDVPEEM